MTAEYRIAAGTAVVRRPNELTLLALDGRSDPQPVVVRDTGVEICDALMSWVSVNAIVTAAGGPQGNVPAAEIEAGVRGFLVGLCELGVVSSRVPSPADA